MADLKMKEMKAPGAFQIRLGTVRDYVETNRKRVYAAAAFFCAVILMAGGWYLYRLDYEKSAQKLYAEAFSAYHLSQPGSETSGRAVQMYGDLVRKFPGSRAATNALFSMGNLYYAMKDYDRAIQAYQDALSASGLRNEIRSLAYSGLAYCYEAKGDVGKALEAYEKSIPHAPGGAVLSAAYSGMAAIYLEKKDLAKALEYYRKAQEQKSDPVMDAMIRRKIAELEA